jgi:hypothetical protein
LGEILSLGYPKKKKGWERGEFESYKDFFWQKMGYKVAIFWGGKQKQFARFWSQLQGPLPEYLVGFKTILLCSLAGSQTWVSPLLEACQSTYLTNSQIWGKKKKKHLGQFNTNYIIFRNVKLKKINMSFFQNFFSGKKKENLMNYLRINHVSKLICQN